MILHILTQSPATESFRQCLSALTKNDAILLIQDAVYAQWGKDFASSNINNIYALTADRQARGLQGASEGIKLIDYAGFVALTLEYDKTVTW
jgi:tRNA 2-thiouridine synthesizing protein B